MVQPLNRSLRRSDRALSRVIRLSISTLTVAVLLVTLIAMHAMTGLAHHSTHETESSGTVSPIAVAAQPGTANRLSTPPSSLPLKLVTPATVTTSHPSSVLYPTGGGCDDMCEIGCLMLGVICSLTALCAVVWIAFRSHPPQIMPVVQSLWRASVKASAVSIAVPRPCLQLLSISRT